MSKLSYEDKINLYKDRQNGMSIKSLSIKYNIRTSNVIYLTRLIEKHGFDILRTSKNQIYKKEFKRKAINRVILNNDPVWTVAIDIGLCGDGMLQNWIKKIQGKRL